MQTSMAAAPSQSSAEDFALMRGGPFFQLLRKVGLDTPEHPMRSALRRMAVVWGVGLAPLLLLCFWEGSLRQLASERRVQAELLFALPVLLAGELYVNGRVAWAAQRPVLLELLSAGELEKYHASLIQAARLRDLGWAEGVLLLLAYGMTLLQFELGLTVPGFALRGESLTAPGAWYALVSYPLFWFLLLRWVWRFLIWEGVLLRLSRLELQLTSTHADRTGGLRFLATCQASFSVVVFAVGAVVGAVTRTEATTLDQGGLLSYAKDQLLFAILALVILNLPLLPFTRKLLEAKRLADARFSALMARHAHDFEQKWFGDRVRSQSPLGMEEISTQTDLTSAFDQARKMRWFPYDLRSSLAVVMAALLLPLLPRLISDRQLLDAVLLMVPKMF